MPRSVFLGRVVQAGEPIWLEDDQDWALALQAEDDDRCPGCGLPRSESQAVVTDSDGYDMPAHWYQAEAVECMGCRAVSIASNEDRDHAPHPTAISYRITEMTTPGRGSDD